MDIMVARKGGFLIVFLFITSIFLQVVLGGSAVLPALADNGALIFTSSNGTSVSSIPDSTSIAILPSTITLNSGTTTTFTLTVTDTSSSPTTPTGAISLSDHNAGGTFNPVSCTLSSASCTISYTSSTNSQGTVTITASYEGDSVHSASTGTATLTMHLLNPTQTTITSSSGTLPSNRTLTFSVQVIDASSSPAILSNTVTFSDNNAGGTFNPVSCT